MLGVEFLVALCNHRLKLKVMRNELRLSMSPTLWIACIPQDRAGRKVVCVKGYRVLKDSNVIFML